MRQNRNVQELEEATETPGFVPGIFYMDPLRNLIYFNP